MRVILTVTLNAALDVTYEVDEHCRSASHRVRRVLERPGGKGVNVARVLRSRGVDVLVTGLAGGARGTAVRVALDRDGIRHDFATIVGDTRATVTVVDAARDEATVFNEPGPSVRPDEWMGFLNRYRDLVAAARVVVLAGSLPTGVPPDAYAVLVREATEAGAATVVDAAGAALRHAIDARPTVVKANAEELLSGLGWDSVETCLDGLLAVGVDTAIVTLGADGLVAARGSRRWRAAPPERVRGNATGAGDACTAAVAEGLLTGRPLPDVLRVSLALSAAAVAAPVAGEFDDATFTRVLDAATVRGQVAYDRD